MVNSTRPTFSSMINAYPTGSAEDVFNLIGGKVRQNNFANSCAVRVSRALNYSSHSVPFIPPNLTVTGSDEKWYIYRVTVMIDYLTRVFGAPDLSFRGKVFEIELSGKKGIIAFEVDGWDDASGHVTLWDGSFCSDECYFSLSKKVMLWTLA